MREISQDSSEHEMCPNDVIAGARTILGVTLLYRKLEDFSPENPEAVTLLSARLFCSLAGVRSINGTKNTEKERSNIVVDYSSSR
jgi:hypothetical protein